MLLLIKNSMRKNVTEYLDITEGLYSEKIAVEDANGCITFGEMKRNALKIWPSHCDCWMPLFA